MPRIPKEFQSLADLTLPKGQKWRDLAPLWSFAVVYDILWATKASQWPAKTMV